MFASGVDTSATETKGTVLIHSAEQVNYENYLILLFLKSISLSGIYIYIYNIFFFGYARSFTLCPLWLLFVYYDCLTVHLYVDK